MGEKNNLFKRFSQNVLPLKQSKLLNECNTLEKKAIQFANNIELQVQNNKEIKKALRKLVGKEGLWNEKIGDHPDFVHLENNQEMFHYIVSVFLDIKGSTDLATRMSLQEVKYIKNRVLSTAIDIFQAFDAHIHRLQGDAVVAFWGGKNVDKENAIIDSLNGTSFLQYFFEETLAKTFIEQGYPPIKIRIGIDFGDTEQVLWSKYGIKDCCEITTTSIHTDLAAKLESKAPPNGTMIGQNVVEFLDLPHEFISIKKNRFMEQEIYVKDDSFLTYRMWKFDWKTYLSRFNMFSLEDDEIKFNSNPDFEINCYYKTNDEDAFTNQYYSNCGVLDKNLDLKFKLKLNAPIQFDEILWEVNNRGTEAEDNETKNFEMTEYRNKIECFQRTKYRGHHYMKCIVKNQQEIKYELFFGIYIR